ANVEFFEPDLIPIASPPSSLSTESNLNGSFDPFFPDDPFFDEMTGQPIGVLDVNGFIQQDPIIQDVRIPGDLLGSADIRVHTPLNPFGVSVINTAQTDLFNGQTVISTTVLPPDDDSISVQAEKERIGLDEGYDMELGFWFQFTPIQELPIGEDMVLMDGSPDFFYYLSIDEDMIIGFNDSITAESFGPVWSTAMFTNTQSGEVIELDARANDIMNFDHVRIDMLPAGNYTVQISSLENTMTQFRLFGYQDLDTLEDVTVTQNLGDNSFFRVPTDSLIFDAYNLTYIDAINMSASFTVSTYDSTGNQILDTQYTFNYYGNNVSKNLDNNDTLSGGLNIRGGYIQVRNTGNTVWNSTFGLPTELKSDDMLITSKLRIELVDNFDILAVQNPDTEYFIDPLPTTSELNGSKNDIEGYFTFTSEVGGNRLILHATNMTISAQLFADGGNEWLDVSSIPTTIDGIVHNILTLEFATAEVRDFIVFVDFNPIGVNGTFIVETELNSIYQLPSINLRTLTFTKLGTDGVIPEVITTSTGGNPAFSINESIGVTAIITVGAGVIYYVVQVRGFKPNLKRFIK
ncbi:MAG: hypothetical protein ACC656_04995, partial [Candidatus Heimdallarchaeota archaeon]